MQESAASRSCSLRAHHLARWGPPATTTVRGRERNPERNPHRPSFSLVAPDPPEANDTTSSLRPSSPGTAYQLAWRDQLNTDGVACRAENQARPAGPDCKHRLSHPQKRAATSPSPISNDFLCNRFYVFVLIIKIIVVSYKKTKQERSMLLPIQTLLGC